MLNLKRNKCGKYVLFGNPSYKFLHPIAHGYVRGIEKIGENSYEEKTYVEIWQVRFRQIIIKIFPAAVRDYPHWEFEYTISDYFNLRWNRVYNHIESEICIDSNALAATAYRANERLETLIRKSGLLITHSNSSIRYDIKTKN